MAARPIRVRFVDIGEVRMGSAYRTGRAVLSGSWVPELPNAGEDFQDIAAWSPGDAYLALVQRMVVRGSPGFRVVVIDVRARALSRSRRIAGCCESLTWIDGGFEYTAFREVRGRVAAGESAEPLAPPDGGRIASNRADSFT